jgi:iron complex outermembrane receptor protein
MNISTGARLRALILVSASVGAGAPAASSAAERAADEAVLEEVVVTAQRREESAQSVAIAVTALSGDELNDKAVTRLDDLQFASPALTITDAGLSRSVNIRGIGLASGSPAVTAGVATYVDGVFQPPIATGTAFYDIATVEVLRGPQGTFVGSSSTGGAIFINSRSPVLAQTDGYAELMAGNYSTWGAQGAINVPVSDTLAVRFAGNHRRHDSYYSDGGPLHSDAGKLEETSGRFGLLWQPGSSFQALLKAEMTSRDTGGYAYRPIPTTQYASLRSSDIRQLTYDDPAENDERAFQSTLELRYELPSGVVLRSLSGFQNKRINNLYDSDATIQPAVSPGAFPRGIQDQFVRERVWTQELNLISPTDDAVDWIAGGYYQRNRIDVVIDQLSDGFPTDIDIHNRKSGTGFFAQVGYKFTPSVKLNVGGRYSTFDVTQLGAVIIGRGIPVPPFNSVGLQVANLAGTHDDGRATGKVALEWTPNENHLFYGFLARGYKPGGFNSATSEFDPETVLDYELGWKATLLEGRLRTQIGGFWNDYSSFQLDLLNPESGQVQTQNLPDATIRGLEAQAQARIGAWGVDLGVAYVDSKFSDVQFINQRALPPGTNLPQCAPGVPPGTPATCFDYSPFVTSATGRTMLYSPEVTYNAGVDYTFALGEATLRPRINYAYIGEQYTSLLYSPVTDRLAARGLLSAQLTYSRESWTLEAYGTNLADKEYVSGQFGNNEFYGAPREYGVRGSVRF